jgi:aromatic ring hydroxylase
VDSAGSARLAASSTRPPREFGTVFEVPADALGLKFQARELGVFPDTKLIDLGL